MCKPIFGAWQSAATCYTTVNGAAGGNSNDTQVIGWTDVRNGLRAYNRPNGEYEIFNEDAALGKVVLYRRTP